MGRSASLAMEPMLPQRVTLPMDAERPMVRYDAERRNEGMSTGLDGGLAWGGNSRPFYRSRFQLTFVVSKHTLTSIAMKGTHEDHREDVGEDRRTAIISAARRVFVEKASTERPRANWPMRQAFRRRFCSSISPTKKPSTRQSRCPASKQRIETPGATGVAGTVDVSPRVYVHDLVSHVLEEEPEEERAKFFRLILAVSWTRRVHPSGHQGGPAHWVKKVEECIRAANRVGDMHDRPVQAGLAGWMVHQLIPGFDPFAARSGRYRLRSVA